MQNWEKLISISHDEPFLTESSSHDLNPEEEEEGEEEEVQNWSISRKLSLRNIAQRYLEEMQMDTEQKMDAEKQTEGKAEPEEPKAEPAMEAKKERKEYGKGKEERGMLKDERKEEERKVKTKAVGIPKGREKQGEKENEEEKKWTEMKNILIKYDVSMDHIQRFQKFRLRCKIKNLPPPPSGGSSE
ncbi:hypothetical protein SUGI_0690740 [Cryptomeria japonica]|nr:hypothetical protein SUGI_0690740 [Cryptomeria japonica]